MIYLLQRLEQDQVLICDTHVHACKAFRSLFRASPGLPCCPSGPAGPSWELSAPCSCTPCTGSLSARPLARGGKGSKHDVSAFRLQKQNNDHCLALATSPLPDLETILARLPKMLGPNSCSARYCLRCTTRLVELELTETVGFMNGNR